MQDKILEKTLREIARFYDERKVGHVGALGFRRSTDVTRLVSCLGPLIGLGKLKPGETLFMDMGCGDGRVNVLFSYLAKISVGIELDEWTLDDYAPLKMEMEGLLREKNLPLPPDNICLFEGDTMDHTLHETVYRQTGIRFEDVDLFYTYLTMQDEFAGLISRKAKKGALFMVYGLEKILPLYEGLHLLTPESPLEGALVLYQKK